MYQSITKKLTLWVAFLSLLLLAGWTGKQEETTVRLSNAKEVIEVGAFQVTGNK